MFVTDYGNHASEVSDSEETKKAQESKPTKRDAGVNICF